jgi:hypothetical protein
MPCARSREGPLCTNGLRFEKFAREALPARNSNNLPSRTRGKTKWRLHKEAQRNTSNNGHQPLPFYFKKHGAMGLARREGRRLARNSKGAAPTAGQTDWYFRLEPRGIQRGLTHGPSPIRLGRRRGKGDRPRCG